MDNATKFTYLLSNTEGTARNAIEGIPLTPENYTQAVDILKKRFGRPRQVIREHLAALWREPACREMTAQGIQSLVDEVTKHLRCLTALDRDPFAGRLPVSQVLMPMLLDKPDAAKDEDNLQKFLEFAQWQANLLAKSKGEDVKPPAAKSEHRPPSPRESTESSGSDRSRPGLFAVRSTSGKGLQTARACAYGPNGNHMVVNCLLDTGPHERCRFTALGGRVGPECRWRRVEFQLGTVGGSSRPDASTMVRALAIPRVCGKVQPGPAESPDGTLARNVPKGGQRQRTPLMVDVLVDIDYYYELVTVAIETRLGWITCKRTTRRRSIKANVLSKGEDSDDSPLRKFREVGSSGIAPAGNPAADGAVTSKRLERQFGPAGGKSPHGSVCYPADPRDDPAGGDGHIRQVA
ncbi:hypothetical protein T06_7251 [Trichinella sp. T6]|nr:hypothetical protein T06_7251 [Trichinella sp. T6]